MKIVCPELLVIFRARRSCEWCKRPLRNAAEPAHVFAKGMGGGGQLDIPCNIVALGSAFECGCHSQQHDGHRPMRCDLLAVVAARYKVTQFMVEHEIYRARLLPKGSAYMCPFTGWTFRAADAGDSSGPGSNVVFPPPSPSRPSGSNGCVAAGQDDQGWAAF